MVLSLCLFENRLLSLFCVILIMFTHVIFYTRRCFLENRAKAKITGKLLACVLALKKPFKANTLSFVGFSLGSVVIKECLKTLHKLGVNNLVHNVTFMAGATSFKEAVTPGRKKPIDKIIAETVSGRLLSLHTFKDLVLMYANSFFVKKPVLGRNETW